MGLLTVLYFSCALIHPVVAQEDEIVPVENRRLTNPLEDQSTYYKDVNNLYDNFIGRWKYVDTQNPITYLEIEVIEIIKRPSQEDFFDEVYLKLKYVENGVIIYDDFSRTDPGILLYLNTGLASGINKCVFLYNENESVEWIPTNVVEKMSPTLRLTHVNEMSMTPGVPVREYLTWEISHLIFDGFPWPFRIPNNIELERM